MSWKAGILLPGDAEYTKQMSARGITSSPVPSIAMSARSNMSNMSRLTEGRRSKLEALLGAEENKPKRVVQGRRRPRVSSSNDLRKVAMLRKSGRNHAAHAQRRAKSTDPSRQQQKQQQGRPQQRYRGSSRAPSVVPSSIAEENDIDSNERGVTVVLPEAVFFNGMNCIERPHWSVVDNGRAANGEDQTMSLSMWLSPSASLRLKKTDGKRTNAARMKSNLATQALQGKEELTLMPGGGSNSSEGGDWYVVVNRQRTLNTQVDPIDRMLGGGDNGGGNGGSSSSGGGGGGSNEQFGNNNSPDLISPTLDTLAQHQLDAAILGADFSVSGMSTPRLSLNGLNGRLCVRAQYRPTDGGPVLEKSLYSLGGCPFGKWTHVVVVIAGASVRLYLDGMLDSQIYLNGPVHMPKEATLYVGRGDSIAAPMNDNDIVQQELGFVGFLAHVIVHGRAIDKLGVIAMASAPRPALPREQDEWSALSQYDALRDKEQARDDRRKKFEQMRVAREQLDAQVAYKKRQKEIEKEQERAADHSHLSKYGAMANQLKTEQHRAASIKKEKAKKAMDSQKAVEDAKNRADQERRVRTF
jgi:hypothetical protein